MIYPDYIRAVASSARRHTGGALTLACLFLLCPAAHARQETPPPTPTAPAAPAALPMQKAPTAIQGATPRAPRPAPAAPAQAPAGPAMPAPRPAAPRRAPMPVVPPREVVTVVHRLSGWKLLAWLATSGPPALELDEWPSPSDAHTNIVAGYVYEDGRSVAARLPQAEVELEAFNAPRTPPPFFAQAASQTQAEPEYMLVTSAGKHVEAKFVGLDSSTGLALLEAGESLLGGEPMGMMGDTDDPTVGQRVRLYAPIPAEAPPPPAARPAPPAPPRSEYISLSIDWKEGRLTHLVRAPSGRLSSVLVSADVSPEWDGAVAANELGEVVGIVSQSRGGETSILPVTTVREACERVLKLRGTAPQPWLGARGDAAARAPLHSWADFGWPQEFARSFIEKSQGVLLNSVAPGTPAALAGLRPGDLIASVGQRDVRSIDDLSQTLKEAGAGSTVDLTVWRALQQGPLKVSVELKGTRNPALATADAEQRAAYENLSTLSLKIAGLEAELSGLSGYAASQSDRARIAGIQAQLGDLRLKLRGDMEQMRAAEDRAAAALNFSVEGAQVVGPLPRVSGYAAAARLRRFGLNAIRLTRRGAARFGVAGGMLVIAMRPGSPAAASGLLPGDVIETVNGAPADLFELRRPADADGPSILVFGLVRGGQRLSVSFPPTPAPERPQR